PVSSPIWRRIPLLMYTQFPWRVLELSALALAILAGVAAHLAVRLARQADWLDRSPNRRLALLVGAGILLLIVPSLVYLYPRTPFLTYGNLTATDVTAFERTGGAIGTTSTGEYYAAGITRRPSAPLPPNLDQIGRLDRAALPSGTAVTFLGSSGYDESYALELPEPTTLHFNLIAFAGWEVAVDGQAVPTRASPGEGLLLADSPAGAHALALRFVDTPIRRAGWILAFATLAVLAGVGLRPLLESRLWARASRLRESEIVGMEAERRAGARPHPNPLPEGEGIRGASARGPALAFQGEDFVPTPLEPSL